MVEQKPVSEVDVEERFNLLLGQYKSYIELRQIDFNRELSDAWECLFKERLAGRVWCQECGNLGPAESFSHVVFFDDTSVCCGHGNHYAALGQTTTIRLCRSCRDLIANNLKVSNLTEVSADAFSRMEHDCRITKRDLGIHRARRLLKMPDHVIETQRVRNSSY